MNLGAVLLALREGVGGGVNPNLMAAVLQGLRESQQGHPYPAHHGPVNFGEQRNTHGLTLVQ